jgi:hypothetical protein
VLLSVLRRLNLYFYKNNCSEEQDKNEEGEKNVMRRGKKKEEVQ